jgi:hypothetical protein
MQSILVIISLIAVTTSTPVSGTGTPCTDKNIYPSPTCGPANLCFFKPKELAGICRPMALIGAKCTPANRDSDDAVHCAPNAICSESQCVEKQGFSFGSDWSRRTCGWYGELHAKCIGEKVTALCMTKEAQLVKMGEVGYCVSKDNPDEVKEVKES